jgi:hypothetical protein
LPAPDSFQQAFAVTEGDADLLKVDLGQLRQHIGVDFALTERGFILTKAKASQPTSEIHNRVLSGSGLMILYVKQRVQGTSEGPLRVEGGGRPPGQLYRRMGWGSLHSLKRPQ